MKKPLAILTCCAVLTSVAFAQTGSKGTSKATSSSEAITVTGTIIKMTTAEGSAANYQPAKTLVVREDGSNTPGSYPNRDQTRHSCAYLLREHRRSADG